MAETPNGGKLHQMEQEAEKMFIVVGVYKGNSKICEMKYESDAKRAMQFFQQHGDELDLATLLRNADGSAPNGMTENPESIPMLVKKSDNLDLPIPAVSHDSGSNGMHEYASKKPVPEAMANSVKKGKGKGRGKAKGKGKKVPIAMKASPAEPKPTFTSQSGPAELNKTPEPENRSGEKRLAEPSSSADTSTAGKNKRQKMISTPAEIPVPVPSTRPKREIKPPARYRDENFSHEKRGSSSGMPSAPPGVKEASKSKFKTAGANVKDLKDLSTRVEGISAQSNQTTSAGPAKMTVTRSKTAPLRLTFALVSAPKLEARLETPAQNSKPTSASTNATPTINKIPATTTIDMTTSPNSNDNEQAPTIGEGNHEPIIITKDKEEEPITITEDKNQPIMNTKDKKQPITIPKDKEQPITINIDNKQPATTTTDETEAIPPIDPTSAAFISNLLIPSTPTQFGNFCENQRVLARRYSSDTFSPGKIIERASRDEKKWIVNFDERYGSRRVIFEDDMIPVHALGNGVRATYREINEKDKFTKKSKIIILGHFKVDATSTFKYNFRYETDGKSGYLFGDWKDIEVNGEDLEKLLEEWRQVRTQQLEAAAAAENPATASYQLNILESRQSGCWNQ